MKKVALSAVVLLMVGCTNTGTTSGNGTTHSEYGNYSGKGGMTAYSIDSNTYKYHYDNGFTGVDAMGWDSNLQYAWSRTAGAKTCGMAVDSKKIITFLAKKYGHDEFIHEINGIDFHFIQQQKIKDFCNERRVAELKQVIPQMMNGQFVKKF
ncbi:hypothetical protein [Moraxella sp. ZY210820]|uniref:hypothetical protein n=1 Tax=unclassified Moraxella TaxID=2685852 RepID=UPI00272FE108|nr:hypothetical protein [Moraxella sp. ZY210820]WLF83012.1 hypothetical protein LU301_06915 [Moraxella sp. ZY210820]